MMVKQPLAAEAQVDLLRILTVALDYQAQFLGTCRITAAAEAEEEETEVLDQLEAQAAEALAQMLEE